MLPPNRAEYVGFARPLPSGDRWICGRLDYRPELNSCNLVIERVPGEDVPNWLLWTF